MPCAHMGPAARLHKFDVRSWVAMLPAHVSRTDDEKGPVASRGGATGQGADDGGEPMGSLGDRASAVDPIGGYGVPDETERTRLIADIMRLIREPAMPEARAWRA